MKRWLAFPSVQISLCVAILLGNTRHGLRGWPRDPQPGGLSA